MVTVKTEYKTVDVILVRTTETATGGRYRLVGGGVEEGGGVEVIRNQSQPELVLRASAGKKSNKKRCMKRPERPNGKQEAEEMARCYVHRHRSGWTRRYRTGSSVVGTDWKERASTRIR